MSTRRLRQSGLLQDQIMDERTVELIDGPCEGRMLWPAAFVGEVPLLLNDQFQVDMASPTMFAFYGQVEGSADRFVFTLLRRIDGGHVRAEFVGGPHNGTRELQFWGKSLKLPVGDGYVAFDFTKLGEPVGIAVYEWRDDTTGGRYHFASVDDSPAAAEKMRALVRSCRIRQMMDRFYANPDYKIYGTPPTDRHKQVKVEYGTWKAEVDEGMAPLILELWHLGFDTLGSCQDMQEDGKTAYVLFPCEEHGRQLHEMLVSAGIQSTTETKRLKIGSEKDPGNMIEIDGLNVRMAPAELGRIVELLREKRTGRSGTPSTAAAGDAA
jgi:hypothetical protein